MACDRSQELMTDAELDSARKRNENFRTETHEILEEELGGDSENYCVDRYRDLEADSGD